MLVAKKAVVMKCCAVACVTVYCVMCCVVLIKREGVEKAAKAVELLQGLDQIAIGIVTSGRLSKRELFEQFDVKSREPPAPGRRVSFLAEFFVTFPTVLAKFVGILQGACVVAETWGSCHFDHSDPVRRALNGDIRW